MVKQQQIDFYHESLSESSLNVESESDVVFISGKKTLK